MPKVNATLKAADPWLKWLIMAGTVTYFVEITLGIAEGNSGHSVFWWVQSFFKVMEEEIDPNIDPLEEFRKERERQLVRWPEK